MDILHPENWPRASGYAHGVAARGKQLFLSGCVGWDEQQQFPHADFAGQVRLALQNIVAVLHAGGALPQHIVRMTWYVTDRAEYLAARKQIGADYREIIGAHYPAMSVVQVVALVEAQAKVEIEVTAVLPD